MNGQRTFRRLTVHELDAWFGQHPDSLLLDARDAASHARDGLPGSLRLSRENQDALLLKTARKRPILIYCYHGRASQTWARMFADFGFTEVCDLIGGQTALAANPANPPGQPIPPELANWLAHQGFAGPDGRGAHENTPLMVAAWRGTHDMVDALLAHGVILNAVNADGNTALWFACVHGEPAGVERLAGAGLPLDHTNATGATCLMYAASSGKHDIVRTLLALGADPLIRTQDDFTALDMAATLECLELLRPR
ncbi:ankyrin repeat domain-containing protein [Paraburkholderia unamae]|uniref:Ankyrin repeat protein n=1 Tax=Paraburkholderia unamae TaxID=219649 RepID=A0ABX5KRG2_9BURK|nr:ankyrin repeat domain-containing protein [Paraburkholderia unamae]PVX85466.1 ankyrin repeat protein [Paraburkholderia unamae]RAR55323.1 ankyrin repeat protein [Paraburkholderia unamae]CAG9267842.1 Rhodanese-like domain-containing protein [Paraburkholderia unamae]